MTEKPGRSAVWEARSRSSSLSPPAIRVSDPGCTDFLTGIVTFDLFREALIDRASHGESQP